MRRRPPPNASRPPSLFGAAAAALLGAGAAAGRLTGLAAWTALLAAAAGAALLAFARGAGRPDPRLAGALLVAIVVLPLPLASARLFAPAPLARPPSAVADLAGAPGRVFPVVSDRVVARGARPRDAAGSGAARRARGRRAALSGYTNLPLGLSSAASPSPIGNPRLTRLLGAALSGGNAETILALVDVRHVVSPFPTTIPGARLERRDAGVLVYALSAGVGTRLFRALGP